MPIYSTNPTSSRNYSFEEFYEAGMVLLGSEVKSIKQGKFSIKESYVILKKGELFIINSYVPKYSASSFFTHDEKRDRKLLLNKSEIRKLIGKIKIKGYALIPIKVYSKKNIIKIEIGLGKGKKLYDKRADIKKKEINKQLKRSFKSKISI
tara:strand:+ start:6215 stop:6667 length:453 start_codon:yes stop_codon:yes gene_type:complete